MALEFPKPGLGRTAVAVGAGETVRVKLTKTTKTA
jgi:hypothetical protein